MKDPYKREGRWHLQHRLIVEEVMGRLLPATAVIHHLDGDGKNNANTNLVVCENQAYHMLLEQRTRALLACGNPRARRCSYCKTYDRQGAIVVALNNSAYHRDCSAKRMRDKKEERRRAYRPR